MTQDRSTEAVEHDPEIHADDLKQRILGALEDYAATPPEEGESWESWFHAAFELMKQKVADIYDSAQRYHDARLAEISAERDTLAKRLEEARNAALEEAAEIVRGSGSPGMATTERLIRALKSEPT